MTADFELIRQGLSEQDLEARQAISRIERVQGELVAALEALLDHYVTLANSGDAGFWNPEDEDEVKNSRAALATARGEPA